MQLLGQTRPVRTVAPAADLLSLSEVKAHLRVTHTDQDTLIGSIRDDAAEHVQTILGRALVNQTWAFKGRDWPGGDVLSLPFPDVSTVTLGYYDTANASQTFASSNWYLTEGAAGSLVTLTAAASWPSVYDRADAITVTMVAGYGATAASVPPAIRRAALMLCETMFDVSGGVITGTIAAEAPLGVQWLLAPYRRVPI